MIDILNKFLKNLKKNVYNLRAFRKILLVICKKKFNLIFNFIYNS